MGLDQSLCHLTSSHLSVIRYSAAYVQGACSASLKQQWRDMERIIGRHSEQQEGSECDRECKQHSKCVRETSGIEHMMQYCDARADGSQD